MATQRRILVVEDSKDILFLMKTELEWGGYVVDIASDGYEGLKLAESNCPDVIVSDIQMPGLDGFEFVRRLRETPRLATVPTIALSGFDAEDRSADTVGDGFTARITKPVDCQDLIELIRKLTPKRKQADAFGSQ